MKFRFAHLADLHVGAWRERALAETNLSAVRTAFERCIEERVDFIVIAGDLFDATLPDMAHVRETADLWFHTLVMLAHLGLGPEAVLSELERRFGLSGLAEKAARSQGPAPAHARAAGLDSVRG